MQFQLGIDPLTQRVKVLTMVGQSFEDDKFLTLIRTGLILQSGTISVTVAGETVNAEIQTARRDDDAEVSES